MKVNFKSPHGMDPKGKGPTIVRYSLPFLLTGIILSIWFPELAKFSSQIFVTQIVIGIILLFIGSVFYITALVQFIKGFPKGKLITNGVYRLSRNPIYSAWIIFIFPGLALTFNNWLFAVASISMYVALLQFIHFEEENLKQIFKQEYSNYSAKVGRLFLFI